MKTPILALSLVLATPVQAATDRESAAVTAAEDGYTRALTGRDMPALTRSLSGDLLYVHANGQAQNRDAYLKGTLEGGFAVRGARVLERHAEAHGRMGFTSGTIAYDVGKGEHPARYMAVYRKEHGRWLLLCWQNTRLAQTSP